MSCTALAPETLRDTRRGTRARSGGQRPGAALAERALERVLEVVLPAPRRLRETTLDLAHVVGRARCPGCVRTVISTRTSADSESSTANSEPEPLNASTRIFCQRSRSSVV